MRTRVCILRSYLLVLASTLPRVHSRAFAVHVYTSCILRSYLWYVRSIHRHAFYSCTRTRALRTFYAHPPHHAPRGHLQRRPASGPPLGQRVSSASLPIVEYFRTCIAIPPPPRGIGAGRFSGGGEGKPRGRGEEREGGRLWEPQKTLRGTRIYSTDPTGPYGGSRGGRPCKRAWRKDGKPDRLIGARPPRPAGAVRCTLSRRCCAPRGRLDAAEVRRPKGAAVWQAGWRATPAAHGLVVGSYY